MEIIRHRRNLRSELEATPSTFGIEVDIRTRGDRLILHHDPYVDGENFEDWLSAFRHGTLILNVKEEGLEGRLVAIMRQRGIEQYFFLDQSFPFLVKTTAGGESRCAVRISEYESIDTALSLAGKAQWIWVDCFTRFPLSGEQARALKQGGFKLCLVSPELQGRAAEGEIPAMRELLQKRGITADAVCTKAPDFWT